MEHTLVLVHVAEHLLHGRVADGPLEEDLLYARRADETQQRQHEQQPSEAWCVRRVLPSRVLSQHHLRLVLQVLHLRRVLQPPRLWNTTLAPSAPVARGVAGARGQGQGH